MSMKELEFTDLEKFITSLRSVHDLKMDYSITSHTWHGETK